MPAQSCNIVIGRDGRDYTTRSRRRDIVTDLVYVLVELCGQLEQHPDATGVPEPTLRHVRRELVDLAERTR